MTGVRTPAVVALLIVSTMTNLVVAQNPKPPTPLPAEIQSVDQLPTDAVVLWIDGDDLTVYIDSMSSPEDQHYLLALQIEWEGVGPGFVFWDSPSDVPYFDRRLQQIRPKGFGLTFDFEDVIPDGYLETWSPAESWVVDGLYPTGGTLDRFDADSPYFGPVPEPSSWTLLYVGMFLLRRRP